MPGFPDTPGAEREEPPDASPGRPPTSARLKTCARQSIEKLEGTMPGFPATPGAEREEPPDASPVHPPTSARLKTCAK